MSLEPEEKEFINALPKSKVEPRKKFSPVPPAGGEVEVVCYQFRHSEQENWYFTDKASGYWEHRGLVLESDHRAQVTRLQAENAKLLKFFNDMTQTAIEFEGERDALKAEVERLKNIDHRQILAESAAAYLLNSGAENFIGDVFTIDADDGTTKFEVVVTTQKVGAKSPGEVCNELQSELTKAKAESKRLAELDDQTIKQLGDRLRNSESELTKARELLTQGAYFGPGIWSKQVLEFLAHQTAPPTKCEPLTHKFVGGKCSVCGLVMYAPPAKGGA